MRQTEELVKVSLLGVVLPKPGDEDSGRVSSFGGVGIPVNNPRCKHFNEYAGGKNLLGETRRIKKRTEAVPS